MYCWLFSLILLLVNSKHHHHNLQMILHAASLRMSSTCCESYSSLSVCTHQQSAQRAMCFSCTGNESYARWNYVYTMGVCMGKKRTWWTKQLSSSSRNYATDMTMQRLSTVQLVEITVINPRRMRSEGYSSWFVCLSSHCCPHSSFKCYFKVLHTLYAACLRYLSCKIF